jgi:hypothetical protein
MAPPGNETGYYYIPIANVSCPLGCGSAAYPAPEVNAVSNTMYAILATVADFVATAQRPRANCLLGRARGD